MTLDKKITCNTQKKKLELTGRLALPLRVGERAWIYHHQGSFTTSVVKQILEVSEHKIIFETCNTIYILVCTLRPLESEVMCA